MSGRLVVVSGTGTEIGKTHFTEALLLALGGRGVRAAGVKPVETGYRDPETSDARRLARASSFHVKHEGIRFEDAVSPHIAARESGRPISLSRVAADIAAVRVLADVTVAELAGGLFSPLTPTETNADLAALLRPTTHLLVAPDRLGVLHDLIAATRCAEAQALPTHGIVLITSATPDTSTGRNAPELRALIRPPLLATIPRASPPALAHLPLLDPILHLILNAPSRPL